MNSPGSTYKQRVDEFSAGIAQLRKPLRWIPWLRLLFFLLTGVLAYNSFKFPGMLFPASSVSAFAGFLLAGWYDSRFKARIRRLEGLIRINRQELAALEWDFSGFDPGKDFIDQDHPYAHDLDIFGSGSLFQYLNRTATIFGRERLAGYLNNAFHYSGAVVARQQAVAELAENIEFRQQLRLVFLDQETSRGDLRGLHDWLKDENGMKWNHAVKAFSFLLPAITITAIVAAAAGLLAYQVPLVMVLLQLLIVFAFGRKTQQVHQAVTSRVEILRKYAMALTLAGEVPFRSDFNIRLQENLGTGGRLKPGRIIKQLSTLLNLMDSNLNLLVSVIMNGLFLFNLHVLMAVEKWRLTYRNLVPEWFEVLAELDALASLGTFAFNNPGYAWPLPAAGEFRFVAEKLGHPLIPGATCVTNDIDISGWQQFRIITGANMSGKSTFLRTIGTNMVLAMAGAPVFASKLVFYPIEIHSSIRTNDSLAKRESYFYAELKRLKEIIGELEQGKQKLILLDEILKGTNSSDKQTGSIALIRQLMNYKLAGLFATHDLALGELVNYYPANIRNLCFEIQITGDKMEIDYKLAPGVCKNLNASFLMRNMGIILEDDRAAPSDRLAG